jgi:hypothetical protein
MFTIDAARGEPTCCLMWTPTLKPKTRTQRRGPVVSIPVSYLGGSGFKSRPGDRLSWLRSSVVSSVPPDECRISQLGHSRFLPNTFEFIIHVSPFYSMPYSLSLKSVVKSSTNKQTNAKSGLISRPRWATQNHWGLRPALGPIWLGADVAQWGWSWMCSETQQRNVLKSANLKKQRSDGNTKINVR